MPGFLEQDPGYIVTPAMRRNVSQPSCWRWFKHMKLSVSLHMKNGWTRQCFISGKKKLKLLSGTGPLSVKTRLTSSPGFTAVSTYSKMDHYSRGKTTDALIYITAAQSFVWRRSVDGTNIVICAKTRSATTDWIRNETSVTFARKK